MPCGRRYRRILLRDYLRLYERNNKELLGYISNITIDGAQVVSTAPLEKQKIYALEVELPRELDAGRVLMLEASIVWSKPDVVPKFFDTGLRFVSLTAADKKVIYELIAFLGLDDSWDCDMFGAAFAH